MSNVQAAARSVERILLPYQQAFAEAYLWDSHYDGGEWSGPALASAEEAEEERVTEMVAARFDVPAGDLRQTLDERQHEVRGTPQWASEVRS